MTRYYIYIDVDGDGDGEGTFLLGTAMRSIEPAAKEKVGKSNPMMPLGLLSNSSTAVAKSRRGGGGGGWGMV